MCDHSTAPKVPDRLVANASAAVGSLIILNKKEECMTCHSTSTDRAKYACPHCSFIVCGICLVAEPFAARSAKCPNCHESIPWPNWPK